MNGRGTIVVDITLAQLPEITGRLAAVVRREFQADLIVYLEEGARVPAVHLAEHCGWPLWPLKIQRPDSRWKRWAKPLLAALPAAASSALRRWEARRKFHRRGPRVLARDTTRVDLRGRRVLIFDDAADSGSTIVAAREWVLACGATEADVRAAVITATTPLGRQVVDYAVIEALCRFPWSADSAEQPQHARLHRALEGEVRRRRWRA